MFRSASNAEQFSLTIGGASLRVVRFAGHEGMSQLYAYDFELASAEPIDPDQVGKAAKFRIAVGEFPREIHGIVSAFELIDTATQLGVYRATIVPHVWLLRYRFDCRIFQEQSVPDIIAAVLEGAGIASNQYKIQAQEAHSPREYCVQYRESDWDFISRLMEDEGIFYFFEQSDDGEVLVMSDSRSVHRSIAGPSDVRFQPATGQVVEEEHITSFVATKQLRSGKVSITDFNFKNPALDLMSSAEGGPRPELEIYDYPGAYTDAQNGTALAQIRLEQQSCMLSIARGEGVCSRLAPGYLFAVTAHPRDEVNRQYLILEIWQNGTQPQVMEMDAGSKASEYNTRFLCIPSDVNYRPPRITQRPLVRGVQTAMVVGPSGEEIYTDEYGRVKVQFHWDRKGKKDEGSSCWIRVSQLWAGAGFGAMWIPRIAQEVIVDFLEGDPDRPIITGRVYDGSNKVPYDLPGEKTKSTIRSNSTPNDPSGFNEIRFEDQSGSEEVYMHAQKDMNVDVEHDRSEVIGNNETIKVGATRRKTVDGNQFETVGINKSIDVTGSHQESIGADMTLNVGVAKIETVQAASAESVGAIKALTIGADYVISVGANCVETTGGNKSLTVSGSLVETVTGPASLKAKRVAIEAEEELVLTAGEAKITLKKSGEITIEAGGALKVISKADASVNSDGNVVLKGQKVSVN